MFVSSASLYFYCCFCCSWDLTTPGPLFHSDGQRERERERRGSQQHRSTTYEASSFSILMWRATFMWWFLCRVKYTLYWVSSHPFILVFDLYSYQLYTKFESSFFLCEDQVKNITCTYMRLLCFIHNIVMVMIFC